MTNVDRTARNTNMLIWHKELWLIDHGASLYFHHTGQPWQEHAKRPFVQVKDHVLLPQASELELVDAEFRALLTPELIRGIVSLVPDEWLMDERSVARASDSSPDDRRDVYIQFLTTRIAASDVFVNEAHHARKALV